MTLKQSGSLAASEIRTELKGSGALSLDAAASRSLAGKSSGIIKYSDFYGKSSTQSLIISVNQQELNLRTWALANGWNGSAAAIITVAAGVYIWSDNISVPGLTIDGSWPGGVTLINNGYIMGKGGDGSNNTTSNPGGPAISLGINCTITNNSYIGGGGGGGGVGYSSAGASGGGGAGGGAGLAGGGSGSGLGGAIGSKGTNGTYWYTYNAAGSQILNVGSSGGGGRIFPGTGGAGATFTRSTSYLAYGGESGGGGGSNWRYLPGGGGGLPAQGAAGSGGGGGGWGAAGGTGWGIDVGNQTAVLVGGTGGSAGNPGGENTSTSNLPAAQYIVKTPGGAGGKAIALNGYTCTSSGSGTVYGAVN